MGIDEKVKRALLKGESITLEAKLAERDVTKFVWETHSVFANYIKPVVYYDASDLPYLI